MTTTIKLRRDLSTNWSNSNPILASGEPGLETDTLKVKYGDGITNWANLSYSAVGNATYANSAGTATTATTAVTAATATTANNAITAGTVTANAQPNITSVGTLSSLNVSGNLNAGNINLTGTANLGTSARATVFVGNLQGNATFAQTANTVTVNAQPNITSTGILTSVVSTGNITTTGYFVGDGSFLTNVSGGGTTYSNANVASYLPTYNGNVLSLNITSNVESTSATSGALKVEGGIGAKGNIHSLGEIHSFGNIDCGGNTLFVGPFADASGITKPVIVAFHAGEEYVQAVIKNSLGNGSADWTALADNGTEAQGWTSMGVASSTYNDANYTITEPGDGYLFTNGLFGTGGNLILGTGQTGTVKDIIFTTGGFSPSNEFARIENANNLFHLTRANSGIKFSDGSIQTSANVGSASQLTNGTETFSLTEVGDVVLGGELGGRDRGLVWDYGAEAGGVNSTVRQDNDGLTVRAYTEVGMDGPFAAPVNIVTSQDVNEKKWIFDGDGDLTLPGNLKVPSGNIVSGSISPAFDSAITGITTGNATVIVTLVDGPFGDPVQGQVTISGVTGTTEANGVWGYQATDPNEFQLYTDSTLTTPVDGTTWTAYVSGGDAVSIGTYTDFTIQGGNVSIGGNDNTWEFGIDGNLTLPAGGIVHETGIPFGGLSGNTIALKPAGGINADQQLLVYPTAGQDFNHLHLTSGNLYNTELFLGDDNFNIKLANTGNIIINTNDSTGNVGTWTFGFDSVLSTPVSVDIVAGTSLPGLETDYTDSVVMLDDAFTQNSGEVGYPWGITLPVSYLTYNELIQLSPGTFPNQTVVTVIANNTKNTYEFWQDTIAETNVTLTANELNWTFGPTGNLTLPSGGNLIVSGAIVGSGASPAPTLSGFSSVSALQFTNGNSNVTINSNSNTWRFDSTGNLTIPGSSGGFIKTVANASIGIVAVDNGTNNPAQLLSMTNAGAATSIISAYATNATIQTNATGTINTWAFDSAGNLTLPGNTFAVKYANGTQVSLGGSSSSIANGTSNVSIATSNGNVTIAAAGNTTMTVTGTGANVTGTLTSTGKIGYASGSTVTQPTNRSQGVTINSLAGTIITTSAVMVPNQVDAIAVNNNQVDPATDIVHAQVISYHDGCYLVTPLPTSLVGNGFYLYLKNIDTFSTANEAVTIRFMVIKAPNA